MKLFSTLCSFLFLTRILFAQSIDPTKELIKIFHGLPVAASFDSLLRSMLVDTIDFEVSHYVDSVNNETFLYPKKSTAVFCDCRTIMMRRESVLQNDSSHLSEYMIISWSCYGGSATRHKYRELKKRFSGKFSSSNESPLETFFCGVTGKKTEYFDKVRGHDPLMEIWYSRPCDLFGWTTGLRLVRK